MKEVYKALEALEGGEKLVELVKATVVKNGELEKDMRKLNETVKQYDGVDIAELKTLSEFVETNGGVKALQGAIAKAEGYDTNEERMKTKDAEYEQSKAKYEAEAIESSEKLAKAETLATFTAFASADFKEGLGATFMPLAVERGDVKINENGNLAFKDGETFVEIASGGYDKFKENPTYKPSFNLPSGGDEGGGSGGGGGDTSNKTKTLEEKLEKDFRP